MLKAGEWHYRQDECPVQGRIAAEERRENMELISKEDLLKQIDKDSRGQEGYYGDEWKFLDTIRSMPTVDIPTDIPTDIPIEYCIGYNKGYIDGCADGEANAKSRPKGKWLTKTDRVWVVCSNCGKAVGDLGWTYPYCPHCTAEMEGMEREE